MGHTIDGKRVAAVVRSEVRERVARLATRGVVPGLATVLVGDDPASRLYVGNKEKTCEEVGIRSFGHRLPASTEQGSHVIKAIPLDMTSADKTRFMAVKILSGTVSPLLGERRRSHMSFRRPLSNPSRDRFKSGSRPPWQQPPRWAANYLF